MGQQQLLLDQARAEGDEKSECHGSVMVGAPQLDTGRLGLEDVPHRSMVSSPASSS